LKKWLRQPQRSLLLGTMNPQLRSRLPRLFRKHLAQAAHGWIFGRKMAAVKKPQSGFLCPAGNMVLDFRSEKNIRACG
jgi:hypothetical protein